MPSLKPKPSPLQFYSTPLPGINYSELQGKLIVIEGPDSVGRTTQVTRLRVWLERSESGTEAISGLIRFALGTFSFQSDAFVHELIDAIIGDNYPVPDRMLFHAERVVHEYLMRAMCGTPRPPGRFDLFATEGGTAAIT